MIVDPSLSLQVAVRGRLTASAALTALVPPEAIHDAWRRPEAPACIVMGEGQTVLEEAYLARDMVRVFLDLHVWNKAPSLEPVKTITGALAVALDGPVPALDGAECVDFRLSHCRYLRDPGNNEWAHAVATVEALVRVLQ